MTCSKIIDPLIIIVWEKIMYITVVLELDNILVDHFEPLGAMGKAQTIARHGVPVANCPQFTPIIMSSEVLQDSGIIYESIDFTERKGKLKI